MKKLILSAIVLGCAPGAFATVVATQMLCADLKAAVNAGERDVVGKNGKLYNLRNVCGMWSFFQTADNGACAVFATGSNPQATECIGDDNGNGHGHGNQ